MQSHDLTRCTRGAIAAITALVLPVLLGFSSLGVEVGHWYLAQRQMQGAADAAAISAAARYIVDQRANPVSPGDGYKQTGQDYAARNGSTIPLTNVCLMRADGTDDCTQVRALDSRTIHCDTRPCIVVEITQNTFEWLTTRASLEPSADGTGFQAIPAPVLKSRSVVSVKSRIEARQGTDCMLVLANARNAIQVRSANTDLVARCGLAIDGGRAQNPGTPPIGDITFSGPAKVHIDSLVVAAASSLTCPDGGVQCFKWSATSTTTPLLPTDVIPNTATSDPYAAGLNFPTAPSGVKTGGVAITNQGAGYTDGTRTFTTTGGAKFTANVIGGEVTSIIAVTDPGVYTAANFPTGPVTATPDTGTFTTAAIFTLTQGCFTWNGTPIAGRKYCSINITGGTTTFPAGKYYIAGGDSCMGFCVTGNNTIVKSVAGGVTFYLTNDEGSTSGSYARVNIASGNVCLYAPGTSTGTADCTSTTPGTTCNNTGGSCLLFVQDSAAPSTTSLSSAGAVTPSNTAHSFSGNGTRTLSGLVYIPKQTFTESGNGPIGGCFGVIAKYVDIAGTPTFANGCLPGSGIGGGTTITYYDPFLSQ
jgi:hypothetical protein